MKQKIPAISRGVLVGINHYSDSKVRPLQFAVSDASELYQVLTNPPFDSDPDTLKLLKSVNEHQNNASRRSILRQLKRVVEQGRPGETLLFYFAGHGVLVDGKPHLCPSDMDHELLEDTTIPLSRLKEIIATGHASVKLILLDACHAGVSLGAEQERQMPFANGREFQEQARDVFKDTRGVAMLAASSLEETAIEVAEKRHGAFTWLLLEALRNLYAVEQNRDNYISVTELFHYVAKRLKEEYNREATILLEGSGDPRIFTLPPPLHQVNPVWRVFPQAVKDASDFFGQDEALKKVKDQLLSTADILIYVYGERGIGKTSFANRIKVMLDEEMPPEIRFLHFSIESGGIRTVNDLARELWEGLVRTCHHAFPSFSWQKPFSFESYTSFGFDLEEMLRPLSDTRFVVFLDDADRLFETPEKLLDKQVLALIGFIIQRTNLPIAFVFTSLIDHDRFFRGYGSPPSILPIYLEPLQRTECDALLDSLLGQTAGDKTTKESMYKRIYRLSGGNPYLAKLLASICWEENTMLGEPEWQSVIEQSVNEASSFFDFIYKSFLESERFVMLNMALKPRFFLAPGDIVAWETDKRTAARTLESKYYLLSSTDGGYRLRMELLGEWLQRWPQFPLECERLNIYQGQMQPARPDPEGICVDIQSGKVYIEGVEVHASLSHLQYQALVYLARHVGRVVSRQELFEALHNEDEAYLPTDQSLDALIYRLRLALGDREQRYLQTLRKRGYLLKKGRLLGRDPGGI